MKPAPFEYHRPATAAEAVTTLAELGDTAKLLAGGQSLVPMLALRLAAFERPVPGRELDDGARIVAEVPQEPPEPLRAAPVPVGDYEDFGPDPRPAGGDRKVFRRRQRMPPAAARNPG